MKQGIILLVILLLLLRSNVMAEKIVFAIVEDFPPYQYVEKGQATGIDVDVLREACKQLGLDSEFRVLPWKRILKNAKEGRVTAIPSLLYKEERTTFLYFGTEPTHINTDSIMARKGSSIKVSKLDDLKNKVVGVIRGYSYGPAFDSYQGLKKEICDDHSVLIRILNKGRIDMAVASEMPFRFNCKKLGLQDRFETVYVISQHPTYTGFSKKALGKRGEAMAEKFSKMLRQLKANGFFQKTETKYLR